MPALPAARVTDVADSADGAGLVAQGPDSPDGADGADSADSATRAAPGRAVHDATAPDRRVDPLVAPVLAWFDEHARDLPWRAPDRTPWGVLVSEVMLQQTPVVRVLPRWLDWMARWPSPADLADAPTADVLRAWDRLGYPRRALRLQQCAVAIVERHGGEVPTDEDDLRALPGIGAYTAAAVVAFAFGRRSVVLDTNVRRVLARTRAGLPLPPPHLGAAERAAADDVVPADDATAARWSAAVMELGALVCTARSPRCDACPVADACAWRADGRPEDPWAHVRRRQAWAGTDRQVRGLVMAALRAADHPVPEDRLGLDGVPAEQRARAVAGLVADGLVVREPAHGGHGGHGGPGGRAAAGAGTASTGGTADDDTADDGVDLDDGVAVLRLP